MRDHEAKALRMLRAQAVTRSHADWLWGINLTRYARLALAGEAGLKSRVVAVGRVRSPVLATIADRCREVMLHQSEPFFQARITFCNDQGESCEAKLLAPPELKFGTRDSDWSDRDALNERLEAASYPVRESRIVFHSNDNVEVAAVLVPLAAAPDVLDAVVADLSKLPGVSHATWQVNALE